MVLGQRFVAATVGPWNPAGSRDGERHRAGEHRQVGSCAIWALATKKGVESPRSATILQLYRRASSCYRTTTHEHWTQRYRETMFSATLHLLLISSLLMCPLRCLAWNTASSANTASPVELRAAWSDCGCCHSGEQNSVPSGPSHGCPEGDCDCGDCLCNGAVTENGTSLDLPALFCFAEIAPVADEQIAPRLTGPRGALDPESNGGVLPNGRSRCVAHQSWLI